MKRPRSGTVLAALVLGFADCACRPTFRALNAQWPDLTLDILVPDTLGRRVCDVLWSDHAAKPDYLKVRKVFLRECTHSREISPKQDQLLRSFLSALPCACLVRVLAHLCRSGWRALCGHL